jgi:nicotinamide-nucleotide amidase
MSDFPLAEDVVKRLKRKKMTLATAESITGGGLGAAITSIPGSSLVFLGGLITYSDQSKTKFLDIAKRILTKHTAVSEEVAIAMAQSVRKQFGSDYAIATTGVAGPGKAYGQKAGTVWVAIDSKKGPVTLCLALSGTREDIRHATIQSALAAFARILIP